MKAHPRRYDLTTEEVEEAVREAVAKKLKIPLSHVAEVWLEVSTTDDPSDPFAERSPTWGCTGATVEVSE